MSAHDSVGKRLAYVEKLLDDSADKQAAELQALKDAHDRHAQDLSSMRAAHLHHASLPERIDSADKHARELQALKDAHDKHTKGPEATQDEHACVDDRIKYLEQLLGRSVDKHACKLPV